MHAELASPNFNFIHCGACTAYSLMKPDSLTESFHTLNQLYRGTDPKYDMYIFLFGEIDCRTLIYHKHKKYQIELSEMINIVVNRYFSAITNCRDNHGFEVAIHGIIPAVQQSNEYNVEFYGDNYIRASINYEFNQRCYDKAIKNRIPYFNCTFIPGVRDEHCMVPKTSLLPDLVHIDPQKVHISNHFKMWMVESGFLP
jgi:hypothetical protein